MNDAYLQYVSTLPPDERRKALAQLMGKAPDMVGSDQDILDVLSIGETNDQISDQDAAFARAQALRETPVAQGRQAGGVYTAANPLEQLAVVGKQIAGVVKEKQANDALGGLRKERTRKRGLYHKLTQSEKDAQDPFAGDPLNAPTEM
jgi:hypothetical protein